MESSFDAAASVASMYGAFFRAVAQEIGMKRALELHAKLGEPFGVQIGEELKQKFGNNRPDTESIKGIFQPMFARFGAYTRITYDYKVTPRTLSIVIAKCPLYEGFRVAGLDHETIGKMCNAMMDAEQNKAKNLYPKIQGSAHFKDSPQGSCVENWTIK